MSQLNEVDYRFLIERLIPDFPPVKRIWPLNIRLLLWILLEAAILFLSMLFNGAPDFVAGVPFGSYELVTAGFIFLSIAAAGMALRNSIPGSESSTVELLLLAFGVIAAALMVQFESLNLALPPSADLLSAFECQLTFAALPWLALFWAARRAMPLRPQLVGGLIGIAASSFSIIAELFSPLAYPTGWGLVSGGAILTLLSVIAGAVWLDPARLWHKDGHSSEDRPVESAWLDGRVIFPLALALAAGILPFALRTGTDTNEVPDFDLAIANYQQSLTTFRPNVPSSSIETVLTAYIEDGMPSYMWDFGPQGFKLVGGRFEHLPDGTPITYTWFRGPKEGVMCMLRQVSGFAAPAAHHSEIHHLLFYRYRGYSVCLTNVGGYGDFVSVIVSPIQMKQFMRAVFGSLSIEEP
jgi:hypothetical protein